MLGKVEGLSLHKTDNPEVFSELNYKTDFLSIY